MSNVYRLHMYEEHTTISISSSKKPSPIIRIRLRHVTKNLRSRNLNKKLTLLFKNDLFTWYRFLVPNFQDSLSPISPISLHALCKMRNVLITFMEPLLLGISF
jgi:hypothetical protein